MCDELILYCPYLWVWDFGCRMLDKFLGTELYGLIRKVVDSTFGLVGVTQAIMPHWERYTSSAHKNEFMILQLSF